MNRIISLAFLLLCWTAVTAAQVSSPTPTPTPNPEDDVVKITTSLIQIDVTVTDSKGRIVRDLKPEEIEIYENRKKQPITNFSFILNEQSATQREVRKNQTDAPALPGVPLKTEQVRRTIALIVDDLTLSFECTYQVRRALKKFVDEQMQEGDLVAIIRAGAGIGALQQFTSDKRMLYAAIERVRWNPSGTGGIGAFPPLQPPLFDEGESEDEPAPGERTPEGIERENNQFRNDVFAAGSLGAVGYVIRGMSELPGRKSVMLLSDGFRMFSKDAGGSIEATRIQQSIRRLVDQANRASVVIYTLDPRGLQYTGLTAADDTGGRSAQQIDQAMSDRNNDLRETQDGLVYLARQTGGTAFINNNDLSGGIRRVLDDQSYYLVGYEPDESTFDPRTRRFNRLDVKVLRKGTNVRYRSGFFGISDEKIVAAPVATGPQAVMTALMSPFGANGVSLSMATLFGSEKQQNAFVRTLLHVAANDLTLTDGPNGTKQAKFDVLAVAFGDNGIPIEQVGKSYTLTIEKDRVARFLERGFVYDLVVPIKKPGAYQMRVALRDSGSNRIGSATQFIEVPNIKKNRLTLSGVGLENLSFADWEKRSKEGNNSNVTSDPLTDTSLRRFRNGTVLGFGFSIFNARFDAAKRPNLTSQIRLFKDGAPIFTGKVNPIVLAGQTDMKTISFMSSLVLGTAMTAGDYVLEVAVTDNAAKGKNRTAAQFIPFEIIE